MNTKTSIDVYTSSVNDLVEDFVDEPTRIDVLLGRGMGTSRHVGNVNFRRLVSKHVREYGTTNDRREKMAITKDVLAQVQPGRFLEKDSKGRWKEVNIKRAHEKTSQALRDGAAILRKTSSDEVTSKNFVGMCKKDGGSHESPKTACTGVLAESINPPRIEQELTSDTLSLASFDGRLSPEVGQKGPSQNFTLSVDELNSPIRSIECNGNTAAPDMVDMSDDEILKIWKECS